MAFHHDFWVTVGTVAPVIGIAHGAATGRYIGRAVDRYMVERERLRRLRALVDRATGTLADLNERDEDLKNRVAKLDEQVTEGHLGFFTKGDVSWEPRVTRDLEALQNDLSRWEADNAELRRMSEDAERRLKEAEDAELILRRAGKWAIVADMITAIGWALCVAALTVSLGSLASEKDVIPPFAAALITLAAMSLVLVTPVMDVSRWSKALQGATDRVAGSTDR